MTHPYTPKKETGITYIEMMVTLKALRQYIANKKNPSTMRDTAKSASVCIKNHLDVITEEHISSLDNVLNKLELHITESKEPTP